MHRHNGEFQRYAMEYDPVKVGSIDGTDTKPHDRAILRALSSEYTPNKSVKGEPRNTVFVGRLNPRTTQESLETEFSKCGKIVQCRLVRDLVTGRSKCYGFVEYTCGAAADRALRDMHKEYIDNTEIIVEKEAARSLAGWRPRRLGGGFGGRKESGQLRFGCRDRPFRKPLQLEAADEPIAKAWHSNGSAPSK